MVAVAQISRSVVKAIDNLATKEDLGGVETRLGGVEEDLGGIKNDLKIVNRKIDILHEATPNRIEFKDHKKRIGRLEKAVFITP